jgi:DNA-binding transcriptional LysR family regulator
MTNKPSAPAWDDLRMLLAVHRHGSFLTAARSLGVATSTVSRRIEALERDLGRPLVHRRTDGARLDADALRLVALGESFELGLEALRRDALEEAVSGTVRVSLSEGFARPATEVMARLRVRHPALHFELIAESRLADLARREVDVAVRITPTRAGSVVSRFIGRAHSAVFCSREYVDRRLPGARLTAKAAASHDWVGFDAALSRLPQEVWLREMGASRFVLRSSSSAAIEHAVLNGMGLGVLGAAQGRALGLVQVELPSAPPTIDVYIAFHRDAKKTPRVRVVVKALEEEVRRQLGA